VSTDNSVKRSLLAPKLALFAIPLLLAGAADAADAKRGQQLAEGNCVSCHASMFGGDGSHIYTRPDRKVKSLSALSTQVTFCKTMLGVQWFDEDVADVAAYLNEKYYKFKE